MRIERGDGSFDWEFFKEIQQNLLQKNQKNLENFRKEIKQRLEGNQRVSNEEIQKIIEEIKRKLDYLNKYLKIEIDQDLEIPVVKIIERDTNRIIRQIPPEYLLELMKRIDEMLGVLLNERV
ncbi:MAG: flagellar biosynthesis protein FlaG [Aquifex sp.]|nr:MAG: flagellar biosynthesis protein FlaG [Aquifex sp.]